MLELRPLRCSLPTPNGWLNQKPDGFGVKLSEITYAKALWYWRGKQPAAAVVGLCFKQHGAASTWTLLVSSHPNRHLTFVFAASDEEHRSQPVDNIGTSILATAGLDGCVTSA